METAWYTVANAAEIPSPALLIYPDRVEENIRRMIRLAGDVERLRPHMKTNKLPEVIQMQMAHGITKFKCATIAEAEMVATCLAPDVLLAYQPVGPNVQRFIRLAQTFPQTTFSALVDDEDAIRALSAAAVQAGLTLNLFLDLDCGMHRTGVTPGPRAVELYRTIACSPGVRPAGLHVYDGHIHDTDLATRSRICDEAFTQFRTMREALRTAGLPVPASVIGGTPTFPLHARRAAHDDLECSPGTAVFWDWGYSTILPDMDFLPAILVLTRVVSKPGTNLLCLDLGHKAVASEIPAPRVQLLGLPNAKPVGHSEEHLVIDTDRAGEFRVGSCLYGMPWHVCPTVALHNEAVVVKHGRADERWRVVGRARMITI